MLALPVLGEQMLNTMVGTFDVYLAGTISPAATSAIGLAAYVSWLASLMVMLVGTGTTAIVSRHEGQDDREKANHFANQSITLAVILGAAISAIMYIFAPWFANYCNMTGEAFSITVRYLRFDAMGLVFLSILLVGSAALRGVGNMRTPMVIFAIINIVNIVVSSSLVFGIGPVKAMGIDGIVTGTVIARVLGGLIMLIALARGRYDLRLELSQLAISSESMRRILRIGLPAAADGAVMWAGHFTFLAILSRLAAPPLGEAYFAAHIIAIRVEALTYLPAVAWAAATATMIGQSLGAGDANRAIKVGHEGVLQCGLLSIVVAAFFYMGAEQIYELMSTDQLVRHEGVGPFRILALLQPLLVISIVYVGSLRGAGDTRFPMAITLVGVCLRLIFGYIGGVVLHGGLIGAWTGMFADMIWRAIAISIRYARGRWIHETV